MQLGYNCCRIAAPSLSLSRVLHHSSPASRMSVSICDQTWKHSAWDLEDSLLRLHRHSTEKLLLVVLPGFSCPCGGPNHLHAFQVSWVGFIYSNEASLQFALSQQESLLGWSLSMHQQSVKTDLLGKRRYPREVRTGGQRLSEPGSRASALRTGG